MSTNKDVIKRGAIGAVVGGPAGAVVGALSAVEKGKSGNAKDVVKNGAIGAVIAGPVGATVGALASMNTDKIAAQSKDIVFQAEQQTPIIQNVETRVVQSVQAKDEDVENLYIIARRSINNEDYETALRYYDAIMVKRPYDWEALFYQAYARLKTIIPGSNIENALKIFSNTAIEAIDLIINSEDDIEKKKLHIIEIAEKENRYLSASLRRLQSSDGFKHPRTLSEDFSNIAASLTLANPLLDLFSAIEEKTDGNEEICTSVLFLLETHKSACAIIKEDSAAVSDDERRLEKYYAYLRRIEEEQQREEAEKQRAQREAEEASRQERIAMYWEEHQEERKELEQELEGLICKIECVSQKIEIENEKYYEVVSKETFDTKLIELRRRITDLKREKEELGVFKKAKKIELENDIQKYTTDLSEFEKELHEQSCAEMMKLEELKLEQESLIKEKTSIEEKLANPLY